MQEIQPSHIDLNMAVVFEALMLEGSVIGPVYNLRPMVPQLAFPVFRVQFLGARLWLMIRRTFGSERLACGSMPAKAGPWLKQCWGGVIEGPLHSDQFDGLLPRPPQS